MTSAWTLYLTLKLPNVKRAWSAFHQLRAVHLPSVWNKLLSFIKIDSNDPLLEQSVNQSY